MVFVILVPVACGSAGGLVDLMPCLILWRWPRAVYGDSWRSASTWATVRLGHVTNALQAMASLKVDNGGTPAVAWR